MNYNLLKLAVSKKYKELKAMEPLEEEYEKELNKHDKYMWRHGKPNRVGALLGIVGGAGLGALVGKAFPGSRTIFPIDVRKGVKKIPISRVLPGALIGAGVGGVAGTYLADPYKKNKPKYTKLKKKMKSSARKMLDLHKKIKPLQRLKHGIAGELSALDYIEGSGYKYKDIPPKTLNYLRETAKANRESFLAEQEFLRDDLDDLQWELESLREELRS